MPIDPDEFDLDLTGDVVAAGYSTIERVLEQDDSELVVDLTHATTELYPEVPPWAENEAKEIYLLFSEGSLEKAEDLVRHEKIEEYAPGKWHVHGSELYAVNVIDNPYGGVPWTTCTCPNGQNRASRPTCYHSAAVLLALRDRKKASTDDELLAGDTDQKAGG